MRIEQSIFYKKIDEELYNLVFVYDDIFSKENYKDFYIKIKNIDENKMSSLNSTFSNKNVPAKRLDNSFKINFNSNFKNPFCFLISENYLGNNVEILLINKNKIIGKINCILKKPKKWKIFLVHHNHTDIGYTDNQEKIEADYYCYYQNILNYCRKSLSESEDNKFKWNCENLWQVENFFKKATEEEIREFVYFVKKRQIEICANYFNFTELLSEIEFIKSLNFMKVLKRKYNIILRTSMTTDVTGYSYLYPKYLPLFGIKFLNVAPNPYCGKPIKIDPLFYWRYKENGKILVWQSDEIHNYAEGVRLGFSNNYVKSLNELPKYLRYREEYGYKKDYIALRLLGVQQDNSPPDFNIVKIVTKWGDEWEYPKVKNALNEDFYSYIMENEKNIMEVSGILPDWWITGAASAPREVAITKDIKRKLFNLEKSLPFLDMGKKTNFIKIKNDINEIYSNVIYSDEHTFGDIDSTNKPESVNSRFQLLTKSLFAYRAAVKFDSLLDRIAGKILIFNEEDTEKGFYFYNTGNVDYDKNIEISIKVLGSIDYKEETIEFEVYDCFENVCLNCEKEKIEKKHFNLVMPRENFYKLVFKLNIKAFSFKKIKINYKRVKLNKNYKAGENLKHINISNSNLLKSGLENDFYKIKFNESGQIIEILDKEIGKNIIDNNSRYNFNGYIYDEIKDREQFARCRYENIEGFDPKKVEINNENSGDYWDLTPERVKLFNKKEKCKPIRQKSNFSKIERLEEGALFSTIEIQYNHKIVKNLRSTIRLYNNEKKIEFINSFFKIGYYYPHAIFYSFPFKIDNFETLITNSDTIIDPEREQIPGSSTDYYSVDGFSCFYNQEYKIFFYQQDSFVLCFNDINLGKWTDRLNLERPYIFSNIYNNYWNTDFYPFSHGELSFKYIISSEKLIEAERCNRDLIKYQIKDMNESEKGIQAVFKIKNIEDKICSSSFIDISKNNVKVIFISANSSNDIGIIFEETAGRDCRFNFKFFTKIKLIKILSFLDEIKVSKSVNSNSVKIDIKKFEVLKVNIKI